MPAKLVTRVDISTNESVSIKDLDQYSITAKVNINQEQYHLICFAFLRNAPVNLIVFLIREHKPCLNIQSDSIKEKLFT